MMPLDALQDSHLESGRPSIAARAAKRRASAGPRAGSTEGGTSWTLARAGLGEVRARVGVLTSQLVGAPSISRIGHMAVQLAGGLRPLAPSQWYFFTGSLSRRIFTANFFGLLILLFGFGLLTYQHTWLIDAKAESLRTQARMIAVAIASNAKVDTGNGMVMDPDRVLEMDRTFPNWRDEVPLSRPLEIPPERMGPILKRLVDVGDVRVRVYNRDSVKLVDNDDMTVASIAMHAAQAPTGVDAASGNGDHAEKLRSAWTRFTAWVMRSPLQVYREISSNKVTDYPEVQAALRGDVTSALLLNDRGEQIISVFAPIQRLKSIPAFVWVTTRPGDLEHILWRERRPFFGFSLVALLATLGASIMLSRTIGGPMKQLATAAEHVSRNINARHEIPDLPGRRDEVGEMATAYRVMTAALYRRIEASDRFAQDVAHELKNPVAAARSTAESMGYAKTDKQRDELARQMQGELKRLNRLISDVANASRLDAELALQETEPVDVATIVTNITNVFRDIQTGRDDVPCSVVLRIDGESAGPGAFMIEGHEGRLGQVITNLVDNALSFSPELGCVTVAVASEPTAVVVRVDDEGPGIPPDKLDDVFKRFYSDRPQSDRTHAKNSGLGLSISREIVEAHGGTICAENIAEGDVDPAETSLKDRPGLACRRIPGVAGTRFEVRLPRHVMAVAKVTKLGFRPGK